MPPVASSGPSAWTWTDTLRLLTTERIVDLFVVAAFDEGRLGRVAFPMFHEVYLELNVGYLQLASVNNAGGLRARRVDAIDYSKYGEVVDFGEVFPLSLSSLYFSESSEIECVEVNYVTNEESDVRSSIVRCAELVTSTNQRIYFDPMYTSGVRIGNAGDWMREYEIQPWSFEVHRWSRPAA